MVLFKNRHEAGRELAKALEPYRGLDCVVCALPRGGVIVGYEIAKTLKAPLDLIFARKIPHPEREEYAIAAISESDHMVVNSPELELVDKVWFEKEREKQKQEIKRRRDHYLKGKKVNTLKNKVAIIVDDGLATGLTMRAAILEIKSLHPVKIIVAAPISIYETAERIKKEVDEVVVVEMPRKQVFLGDIENYYEDFSQVEDSEVIRILSALHTLEEGHKE